MDKKEREREGGRRQKTGKKFKQANRQMETDARLIFLLDASVTREERGKEGRNEGRKEGLGVYKCASSEQETAPLPAAE